MINVDLKIITLNNWAFILGISKNYKIFETCLICVTFQLHDGCGRRDDGERDGGQRDVCGRREVDHHSARLVDRGRHQGGGERLLAQAQKCRRCHQQEQQVGKLEKDL